MTTPLDRNINYDDFFVQSSRLTRELPAPAANSRLDVSLWLSRRRTLAAPAWPLLSPAPVYIYRVL